MFAVDSYNPFENSLNNAKVVVSLEWQYETIRKNLSKLMVISLVLTIGLPLVFFFGFWLQIKRRKFRRSMRNVIPDFKNYDDYLQFKLSISKLDELMPSLQKVNKYNLKKAPLPVRYTLLQMQKMTSTLITFNDWQKSKLSSLNEQQFKSKSQVFKFVSEQELWKGRNSAYQYWM